MLNVNFNITWKILRKSKPYGNKSKKCQLCLLEKFFIIFKPELGSLNKRNELASSCNLRCFKSFMIFIRIIFSESFRNFTLPHLLSLIYICIDFVHFTLRYSKREHFTDTAL